MALTPVQLVNLIIYNMYSKYTYYTVPRITVLKENF